VFQTLEALIVNPLPTVMLRGIASQPGPGVPRPQTPLAMTKVTSEIFTHRNFQRLGQSTKWVGHYLPRA